MSEIIEKNKLMRAEIDAMAVKEKTIKARINEFKNLIEEKKRKSASLNILKEEEARLLAELEKMA